MGFSFNLDERAVLLLIGIVAVISAIGIVTGYGGTDPAYAGHSAKEVEGTVPPGAVMSFAMASCPSGWVECNGQSLTRSDHQDLFTAIQATYGAVDSSHFNVPDYRGLFLRGVDSGAGRDPDATLRTALVTGGPTGNNVGSYENESFISHQHPLNVWAWRDGTGGGTHNYVKPRYDTPIPGKVNDGTFYAGGNETRPENVYVLYCIKA